LAQTLARESQKSPETTPSTAAPLDLPTAVAALAAMPEAERRAGLDALAVALQALPLAERAALAAKLLAGAVP
jgi:hypothetical protein